MPTDLSAKTKPVYDNCTILAPDGQVLCRTNHKKLNWYLERGLAEAVVIRLNFEPEGRKNAGIEYYLADKTNQCVICGASENLSMHHVVPRCYRRYFPDEYKNHASHDVLATCVNCHVKYERYADELKRTIGEEMRCVLHEGHSIDHDKLRVAKASHALVQHEDVIPEIRRRMLLDTVISYLGHVPSREELITLSGLSTTLKTGESYGEKVVAELMKSDTGIRDFIQRWRKHFVEVMKPQFLPTGWDVEHNVNIRT
jgi:hypothetical protein